MNDLNNTNDKPVSLLKQLIRRGDGKLPNGVIKHNVNRQYCIMCEKYHSPNRNCEGVFD